MAIEPGPFRLLANQRRADQVVAQIRTLVLSGGLGPGDRLPPEVTLAEQMGVSRTALREGMRVLEAQGLVETRQGVGTVVREIGASQMARPMSWLAEATQGGLGFAEFHTVRRILEVETSALAAGNASSENLATLELAMTEMEASVDDPRAFAQHDAAFHEALAVMTGNCLLELLTSAIRELIEAHVQSVLSHIEPVRDVIPYHRAILDAVRSGDPETARQAMKRHLAQVEANYHAASAAVEIP